MKAPIPYWATALATAMLGATILLIVFCPWQWLDPWQSVTLWVLLMGIATTAATVAILLAVIAIDQIRAIRVELAYRRTGILTDQYVTDQLQQIETLYSSRGETA